jgi:hypothetical protein
MNPAVYILVSIAVVGLIATVAGWIYRGELERRQNNELTRIAQLRFQPPPVAEQTSPAAVAVVVLDDVPPAKSSRNYLAAPRPQTASPRRAPPIASTLPNQPETAEAVH